MTGFKKLFRQFNKIPKFNKIFDIAVVFSKNNAENNNNSNEDNYIDDFNGLKLIKELNLHIRFYHLKVFIS